MQGADTRAQKILHGGPGSAEGRAPKLVLSWAQMVPAQQVLKARVAPWVPPGDQTEAGGRQLALEETRSRMGFLARKGQVGEEDRKLTVQSKTMT